MFRRYCKLYLLLTGSYIRSRIQYKLSFILTCVAIIVGEGCMLGLLGALFVKFKAINGWTWTEMAFLYSLGSLSYSLMRLFASQLDDFDRYIVRGDLDIVLVRPLPSLFYILASRLELIHTSRLLTSIVLFAVVSRFAHLHWNVGLAIFIVIVVASGAVIMFSLILISAAIALWTTKSGKLTDILTGAGKEAVIFPISIYPTTVRIFLTFILPMAFVTYYPAQHILNKGEFLDMPEYFQYCSPFVAFIMFSISYALWRLGLQRYQSTGS